MRELDIPPEALSYDDAIKFIRFWVAGGSDHVSLHVGAMGDQELHQWGMMIADITVHVIRALRQDGSIESDERMRASIERGYIDRLKVKGVDYSGSLIVTKQ